MQSSSTPPSPPSPPSPMPAPPTGSPAAGRGAGRRIWAVAAVVALVALGIAVAIYAIGRDSGKLGGPDGEHSGGVTPTSVPPAGGLKPPMQGLVQQNADLPADTAAGLLGGIVALARWKQLQPAQGGPIAPDNPIDRAIEVARAFNKAHAETPIAVKIRIFAGTGAPDWAKSLDGFRPVDVTNNQSGQTGSVGPFWTKSYASAYADLQTKLAARYDNEPLVRDVTISRCMTVFAEPFQRDVKDSGGFLQQGYTAAADQACLRDQIDAHAVWKRTHQSLAFNPYKAWRAGASGAGQPADLDATFTISVMNHCREVLGERCTLENNSIRGQFIGVQSSAATQPKPLLQKYGAMYAEMQRLGPAITFQTASPKTVGDLHQTVAWGASLGANSVEIPVFYDPEAMRADNAALLRNPTGTR